MTGSVPPSEVLVQLVTALRAVTTQSGGGEADPNLKESILASVRQEFGEQIKAAAAGSQDPVQACIDRADELFASEGFAAAVNAKIQEALQAVLPTMVKRFRSEIDQAIASGSSGGGEGGGPSNIDAIVNSTALKEMLEERFRSMLLYLKQDVIPKTVSQLQG